MTDERYCVLCEKITFFKSNRNIMRSECSVCGSRFGIKEIDSIKKLIENLESYKSNSKEEYIKKLISDLNFRKKNLIEQTRHEVKIKGRVSELKYIIELIKKDE